MEEKKKIVCKGCDVIIKKEKDAFEYDDGSFKCHECRRIEFWQTMVDIGAVKWVEPEVGDSVE